MGEVLFFRVERESTTISAGERAFTEVLPSLCRGATWDWHTHADEVM